MESENSKKRSIITSVIVGAIVIALLSLIAFTTIIPNATKSKENAATTLNDTAVIGKYKAYASIDENGNEDLGIYGNLRTGDLINVIGHLQTNNYVGKDGKMVYGGIVLQCDTIRFREPKSVSDARAANKATAVAPQEAPPTV